MRIWRSSDGGTTATMNPRGMIAISGDGETVYISARDVARLAAAFNIAATATVADRVRTSIVGAEAEEAADEDGCEEDCPVCDGSICCLCGAGAWRSPSQDGVRCDHDVMDRHRHPEPRPGISRCAACGVEAAPVIDEIHPSITANVCPSCRSEDVFPVDDVAGWVNAAVEHSRRGRR